MSVRLVVLVASLGLVMVLCAVILFEQARLATAGQALDSFSALVPPSHEGR